MAYEHNDIATKNRLMSGLGEELMGFEHNDIVTVDVMNKAIEEGGGGGSSDFSTATIHIVNTAISAVQGHCPRLVDVADGVTYAGTTLYTEEEEQDFTVILYGHNGAFLSFDSEALTYATSGNIERIDPDYPDFLVTGDCTVTVSQE